MYGVSGIPHAQFQGTTDIIGGGTDMLPHYLPVYNGIITTDSPFEIDLSMNVEGGQYEINADVTVTGAVNAADENKIIFILTYNYGPSYSCSVQRYFEMDFGLTEIGETGSFSTTFALENDWDLANVRGIAIIQKMNGTTGNYPIHQSAIITYPIATPSPIEDLFLAYYEYQEFDLTNYFNYNGAPAEIELSVESLDETVATASLAGNILTIIAGTSIGSTQITISGEYEGFLAEDVINVETFDPNTVPIYFNLFDSYGDGWGYAGNTNYITIEGQEITLPSGGEGVVTVFLTPGDYDYTYTATDNYGSENSWTISLADGTEIGSGSGGANGVYDFTFTVPSVVALGNIAGNVSLSGEGDLSDMVIIISDYATHPNTNGSYEIILNEGTYTLTASLEGYEDYEMEVVITEGETTTLDFEMIETMNADDEIVFVNELKGNYPNPFNPTTTINFSIAKSNLVTLDIYNSRGQKVRTIVNSNLSAGEHNVVWNGKDKNNRFVNSGVYFYKIKSGKFTSTKKMILLK